MSAHFIFPKPSDWNMFEDIVCDVFARKLNNHNFQRYGRSGQRQSGVDIAGFLSSGLLGIQCKHHPTGNITTREIDDEITKSEDFRPELAEFTIVTSADRDATAHSHVLQVSKSREDGGAYPVTIMFWQDVYNWLNEFPDLIYKHFTKYFPPQDLVEISLSTSASPPKSTLSWPASFEELKENVSRNIGGLDKAGPYTITLGLTSFPDITYDGKADLEVSLSGQSNDESLAESGFAKAVGILSDVRGIVSKSYFSNELWIHLQTRLTLAFLLGWIFRRVSHFDLKLVFGAQTWATSGLPLVPSRVYSSLPVMGSETSTEVVIVLNISRIINNSVAEFVNGWSEKPRAILGYAVEGHRITSAAHALSVALEVSAKIKTVIDEWGASKIHLFAALPSALATLIVYHLNAICPIAIYFRDAARTTYVLGGTLDNNL